MHFAIPLPYMMVFSGVVILAAVFQLTISQPPPLRKMPEQCRFPPPALNPTCCDAPKLFTEEDLVQCGITNNGYDCSKKLCILRKYNLLRSDGLTDNQRIGAYLEKLAVENPAFKFAIEVAKKRCLERPLLGPPLSCEPDRMFACLNTSMFNECPVWLNTKECQQVKAHMELCRPYFPKF